MRLWKKAGKQLGRFFWSVIALTTLVQPVSAAMMVLEPVTQDRNVCQVFLSDRENAVVIGNLEDGTSLEVLEDTGDWVRIRCGEMTGYLPEESVKVDDNLCYYVNTRNSDQTLPCRAPEEIQDLQQELLELAREQLGVPYVYGGTTPQGFDCSGFVQYLFEQIDYTLGRTAPQQLANGLVVDGTLLPGDLVFFQGTGNETGIATHVGIFVGEDQFIHASSKRGIVISRLSGAYYQEHFLCARRVILSCVAEYSSAPFQSENPRSVQAERIGDFYDREIQKTGTPAF